jgi:putative ABC transport system permease protein
MAWMNRLWNALRPNRLQHDLEREIAFHINERAEELQEREGLSEAEALRRARRQFGNPVRQMEDTRDMDINLKLDWIRRNIKYATRSLIKTPAFTLTVVLTLALGIGANSAVFSAIYAVLLRPLPFPQGDQLVRLNQVHAKVPGPAVAPTRLEDWNRLNTSFQAVSGYYSDEASELSGEMPEKIRRAHVAPRFLQVLGVSPAVGRDFSPQEEKFGGPFAVILSDHYWRRRFGADPNIVGKTVRINSHSVPIVGVMPSSFRFPDSETDLWSPSPPDAPYAQNRASTWFSTIGRLKPGVTLAQAQGNMSAIQAALGQQYPKTDADVSVLLKEMKESTVGGIRRSLWILFGSVTLLLLIACTNIAALLLSRAAGRQHEISVRFSLGASRVSVAGQLLMEVLLLAVSGAVVGLVVAFGASHVFRTLAKDLPRVEEIGLNGAIVAYSLICAVGVTLLSGIVPAIRSTRRSLSRSLAQGGRAEVSSRGNRLQFLLVGVQVALAVTLLAGAGLLLRSFYELGRVSPGFDPQRILTFHLSTTWAETGQAETKQRLERILDALHSLPGVEAATTSIDLPGVPSQFQIELKPEEGRDESLQKIQVYARWVTPTYFETMRIPLISGQPCTNAPNQAQMMVNRTFVNTYFGGSTALIGRKLGRSPFLKMTEVRGIVGDTREAGMDREPLPIAYWCNASIQPGTYFLVRTRVEPRLMAETIRRKIHEIEPQRSVFDLVPLTDRIADAYAENRLRTTLLVFFAATAILLACVGLYGTLSYIVSIRRREIALRLALGAVRSQVVGQILGQGVRVSALGSAAGVALAAMLAPVLSAMLYGVSVTDKITLAGVILIVLVVSSISSLLPAVRAARLEPMQALREE